MVLAKGIWRYAALLAVLIFMTSCSEEPEESFELGRYEERPVEVDDVIEDISAAGVATPPYIVNVRVIVEKRPDGTLARTPEQIKQDFEIATEFYSPILMSFYIGEAQELLVEEESLPNKRDYRNNADLNSDAMSVFYVFGHKWLTPAGLSAFPWSETQPNGIFVNGPHADYFTLAHEIGHYFGLYHTFTEGHRHDDFVHDTQNEHEWEEETGRPYTQYANLMNYSGSGTQRLTLGQLERVRFFAVTLRSHQILRSPGVEAILAPKPVTGRHDAPDIFDWEFDLSEPLPITESVIDGQ